MSEPTKLNIKRKAADEPPDYLLLQGVKQSATHIRYVRQRTGEKIDSSNDVVESTQHKPSPAIGLGNQQRKSSRRVFQLQRLPHVPAWTTGKRKSSEDGVATFVERKKIKKLQATDVQEADVPRKSVPVTDRREQGSDQIVDVPLPQKRPGKGSAIKKTTGVVVQPETEADRKQIEALAEYMHHTALEDIRSETAPKPVASPRLSGARSRDMHRQRIISNGSVSTDVDMEDESDYIYDTYILAPNANVSAVQFDALDTPGNVGYLVITEEDESLWQTYLDDDLGEKEWDSDEEDENAEGYYGADYPEDELASDDEFDRDAYGYRGYGTADDEEWDQDTGAYSDDEYVRVMEPFSNKVTTSQFATYLDGGHENH